ncbi:outer membrane protein with beta-barrel domain [Christiangramia gaetbulicola]|uniref:Outer membrane protein with beta-barrel domain n=1 Tax=Christiangramia gaetbulicola TaxID=703340 RepID=A0A2T6AKZ7_9FLAO|nr:outer membrane beta-barrel protein [Christiangramia gaetbulicola]PTX44491.1 outer membrane protein with beta-barrel domain [Christiangramia gaetbulicola]
MNTFFQLNPRIIIAVILLSVLSSHAVKSQKYSIGVKAGVNYSLNDNGSEVLRNAVQYSAESDFGYQAGAFLEMSFGKWLLRPEVFLNKTSGKFEFQESPSTYSLEKFSLPLLFGYNVLESLDVYAGPAYQFILNKEMENTREPLLDDHSNLAAQIGFKISFNRLELDLRYDFTFPSEDFQIVNYNNGNRAYFDEGRLNQVLLSLNYKIFGSNSSSTRRGGSCYF